MGHSIRPVVKVGHEHTLRQERDCWYNRVVFSTWYCGAVRKNASHMRSMLFLMPPVAQVLPLAMWHMLQLYAGASTAVCEREMLRC